MLVSLHGCLTDAGGRVSRLFELHNQKLFLHILNDKVEFFNGHAFGLFGFRYYGLLDGQQLGSGVDPYLREVGLKDFFEFRDVLEIIL